MADNTAVSFLPRLTGTELAQAPGLVFTPYTGAAAGWDQTAAVYGTDLGALSHDVYRFTAVAGATYYFQSVSYFDPATTTVYDLFGTPVIANSEADDGADYVLEGVPYSHDNVLWTAPESGYFFVAAEWIQSAANPFYALTIFVHLDPVTPSTPTTPPPVTPAGPQITYGTAAGEAITGTAGADTIIALDGNDTVSGSAGGDDVNGNVGADIVRGGDGDDTVRGGKDNDTVYGENGNDPHVNGNIGDDSVSGGAGDDTLYGGQGADLLSGDAGDDYLSGDLGNDGLTGGAGADRFLLRVGGGFDYVTDFKASEGDRIVVPLGTPYSVFETAGEAYITIDGEDIIRLVGVSQAQMGFSIMVV